MASNAPVSPFPTPRKAPAGWTYLDYPGADLIIQATTKWERGFRAEACAKEPWTVAWIESMVPGQSVFWDVGANVGSYALIAAYRGVYTVAFEPGYASYAALCNNILANRLERKLTPVCAAIADAAGVIPFAYRSTEAGAASHALAAGFELPKAVGTLPMLSLTLDAFDARFAGAPPTHILIDVDGAESLVLQGGTTLLQQSGPSIMIEVPHDQEVVISGMLAAFGYTEAERFTERGGKPLGAIHYARYERG